MTGTAPKTEVFTVTEMLEPAEGRAASRARRRYELLVQPCLAELFGTALFVVVGCSAVGSGHFGITHIAVAHGLTLGVLIMIFGPLSGGHFNPAVSLSVYLCGGMRLVLLLPYVLAQMAGGMIGAGLAKALCPPAICPPNFGGAFYPNPSELARITLTEALLTLILTTVVCMGAVNRRTSSPWAPFCIGLTVVANIMAGGSFSGACMNPARAFGPAVVVNHWSHHWVYWVGPLCGALLTVIFVRVLFGDHKTRIILK